MFSFKSIAIAATLAFAAVSSALTVPVSTGIVPVSVRSADVRGLAAIFTELTADVTPICAELKFLTKANATVEVIQPLVEDIKVKISAAIVEVTGLCGSPKEVILASVNANVLVSVTVLAQLIADLCLVIFGAIGYILAVVDASIYLVISILCCCICELIGALICVVLEVVASLLVGLRAAIFVLIGDCVAVILKLNVSVLISLFGIVA